MFKKENRPANGMISNYVNYITQDRNGLFYVGMYGALQTYDENKFHTVKVTDINGHNVKCYVSSIIQRRNGDVLIGTSGHGVLKMNGRSQARQVGGVLRNVLYVRDIMEDKYGTLWIVTENKGVLSIRGKRVIAYFTNQNEKAMVRTIKQDSQGNIYVTTFNKGLFRMNHNSNMFSLIEKTKNMSLMNLYICKDGKLLLGCDGQGTCIYDQRHNQLIMNPYYTIEVDLSKGKVNSIIEDRSGNIWIGMLQKGVFMQPNSNTGFGYMGFRLGERNFIGSSCVISTLTDSRGHIWVGTDKDGLYELDSNHHFIRHISTTVPPTILSIAEDHKGRIWIGSFLYGCGWIDANTGTYHKFNIAKDHPVSVFDIVEDKQHNVYLATMGDGVIRINTDNGNIHSYVMNDKAVTNRKVNSITNNYISQLDVSPDGRRLYVASTMGLCCLDIQSGSWTKVFNTNCLNYGTVTRVVREDKNHRLWFGTNNGLYCYNLKTRRQRLYSISQGLSDNGITSIEIDKRQNLWLGTDHGLCCLNTVSGNTTNYYADDGLQSNEFSDGASWTDRYGNMVFGGVGGITWFNPMSIHQHRWNASIKLTSFIVGGERISKETKSGVYQITDTTVIASNHFSLSHDDNSFSIQLSTLTYDNPEHITYSYSINGEKWIKLQPGVNEITFSHLSSGKYNFSVKAINNGLDSNVRKFTVVIHPVWYFSIYAEIIYLLLIILAARWYLLIRRRKEQDNLRLQEHIHAEEMGEAKLRFFMNISHEIRTPMTLIIAPLLSLMKEDKDAHRHGTYEIIKRNAERILHLINQMMDLRKIDKGQMIMRMTETNMVGFITDVYTLFEQQAKNKNIKFLFEHDEDNIPVWLDKGNFDKVLMNIFSNAFKFTRVGGEVVVSVKRDTKSVSISVSDDGEIIPEDKIGKIFERFYQTTSVVNDRQAGTGIGLDLTRSLVELHHGTISVHNNENGKGCVFIVTLPLGNAHLRPEEMVTDDADNNINDIEPLDESDNNDVEEVKTVIPTKGRPTIVIVEDDEEIRSYLKNELGNSYNIVECVNGKEGLNVILRDIPSLVISDIMMPEMDGNTLCTKVKTNVNTNHIPVILLTAKNRDEDKLEGLETGADAYIVKPFNMDILRRTIINLIKDRKLLRNKFTGKENQDDKLDEVQVKSPDEKLLERVMAVVNKNLDNTELSVDMIAEEVGISRVHLHRKMKELTNQTPHDLIRNIRLKQAANLLANQHQNVTEVMYACGFGNAASFSTMFKNMYGVSQRDYMKEHLQRKETL